MGVVLMAAKTFKEMRNKLVGEETKVPIKKDQVPKPESKTNDRKYSMIAEDLSIEVFEREYKRLKEGLQLGINKFSYKHLADAVDRVAENARIAHNLWVASKEELQKYEEIIYAKWWAIKAAEAMKELVKLKKLDMIGGQIGEEKIKNYIIANHSDEFEEKHGKLIRFRTITDSLKGLSESWESRKSLLQSQGKLAEKRIIVKNS